MQLGRLMGSDTACIRDSICLDLLCFFALCLCTVGGTSHRSHHLAAMLPHFPVQSSSFDITVDTSLRLVHRLDKETSGCVLLAKGQNVAHCLAKLFKQPAMQQRNSHRALQHHINTEQPSTPARAAFSYSPSIWSLPPADSIGSFIQKRYLAIVHGVPSVNEGCIVSPSPTGDIAHSSYRLLASNPPNTSYRFSLLELIPHTGRKRQLRLHCHWQLHCMIVGEQLDQIGGIAVINPSIQEQQVENRLRAALGWSNSSTATSVRPLPLCLHAHELVLRHPKLHGGSLLQVQAPLPTLFATLARNLFGWAQPHVPS